MVVPFIKAREEVKKRLDAVFAPETFKSFYDYEAPKIFEGFPVNEPPFYISVDEIADSIQTDAGASMGHVGVSFNVNVYFCARHTDLITASNTLMAYINLVFEAIAADHTLNRTVDNTSLSLTTAGTAADNSKRHIAAAAIAITCTIYSRCPREVKEIVDALNRDEND